MWRDPSSGETRALGARLAAIRGDDLRCRQVITSLKSDIELYNHKSIPFLIQTGVITDHYRYLFGKRNSSRGCVRLPDGEQDGGGRCHR